MIRIGRIKQIALFKLVYLTLFPFFCLFFFINLTFPYEHVNLMEPGLAGDDHPPWWDNQIGKDPVVLPGYSSIKTDFKNNSIILSQRKYTWDKGYLPMQIESLSTFQAGPFELKLKVGNKNITLLPSKVKVIQNTHHHVEILAEGAWNDQLKFRTKTRVEYDGLAMVTVEITPAGPVAVQGLDLIFPISDSPSTTIIGFKADGIRKQKNRDDMLSLPYKGEFINVIGLADGNRSFWCFGDNAKGWIWNDDSVTEIMRREAKVYIRQRLIGKSYIIEYPMKMEFNFLATPVKKLSKSWRTNRIVTNMPSVREAVMNGKLKLWWTSAFAYDAFPYTLYPSGIQEKLSFQDRQAYPGLLHNKRLIQNEISRTGIHWIPYFSAHVLSTLSPPLKKYRADWEIWPAYIYKDGLKPYSKDYDKPTLTHRASEYTDYLLWRFNEEIDRLGMHGVYLDHGSVFDSTNPKNGGWRDSNGKIQPSLDILGLRQFLKRLHTLFYLKEKEGFVFVHNSNREIIPAYTFAYGTVDGEQYKRVSGLIDGDYIGLLSLDEVRSRFCSEQYGIIIHWLAEEWSQHPPGTKWWGSKSQKNAYRNHMALSLLHDIPTWPAGSPGDEREKIMRVLDDFGVNKAHFIGYWNCEILQKMKNTGIVISYYLHTEKNSALLIVVNLTDEDKQSTIELRPIKLNLNIPDSNKVVIQHEDKTVMKTKDYITVFVPAKDFRLVKIDAI